SHLWISGHNYLRVRERLVAEQIAAASQRTPHDIYVRAPLTCKETPPLPAKKGERQPSSACHLEIDRHQPAVVHAPMITVTGVVDAQADWGAFTTASASLRDTTTRGTNGTASVARLELLSFKHETLAVYNLALRPRLGGPPTSRPAMA